AITRDRENGIYWTMVLIGCVALRSCERLDNRIARCIRSRVCFRPSHAELRTQKICETLEAGPVWSRLSIAAANNDRPDWGGGGILDTFTGIKQNSPSSIHRAMVSIALSAEREGIGLHTCVEECDLELAIDNRLRLSNQLMQTRFDYHAVPVFI